MTRVVPRFELGTRLRRLLALVAGLGLATFLIGLYFDPRRAWVDYLIALFYVTGLGLGAALFIATQYVCGAGWSVAIRRIPEAMTSILALAVAGVLGLCFGFHALYAGTDEGHAELAAAPGGFNGPALALRLLGCFLLWCVLSRLLVASSRRQDADGDVAHTHRNVRNSALLILFGVWTFCLASADLLMSLQVEWNSTIFGFLTLAGTFLASLAVIALFVVAFRRRGWTHFFTDEHVLDLGRLLLAFSIFWIYLWASQHLLIWYSNQPEETSYYVLRHFGSWGVLSSANVLLNWLVPFALLLSRHGRQSDRCVSLAALSILVGHWLDLYLIAAPPVVGPVPRIGLLELLPFAGACALFLWVTLRSLARAHLVPIRDPYLIESLPGLAGHHGAANPAATGAPAPSLSVAPRPTISTP